MNKTNNNEKQQSEEPVYSIALPCSRELGNKLRKLVEEKHGRLWGNLKPYVNEGILTVIQELEIELYDKIKTNKIPKPVSYKKR